MGPSWNDARNVEDAGEPDDPQGDVACDRAKLSEPCDMSVVSMASCGCGKVYVRCDRHGGAAGARRSLHSHRALYHPKEAT